MRVRDRQAFFVLNPNSYSESTLAQLLAMANFSQLKKIAEPKLHNRAPIQGTINQEASALGGTVQDVHSKPGTWNRVEDPHLTDLIDRYTSLRTLLADLDNVSNDHRSPNLGTVPVWPIP